MAGGDKRAATVEHVRESVVAAAPAPVAPPKAPLHLLASGGSVEEGEVLAGGDDGTMTDGDADTCPLSPLVLPGSRSRLPTLTPTPSTQLPRLFRVQCALHTGVRGLN